ncbi:hypothetical protein AMTRI_Chr12g271630 [Amborella trichopoda]
MGVSRSSSDEEDGDAEWRAGIESVANGFNPISANYSRNPPKSSDKLLPEFSLDEENKRDTGKSPGLKLYQVKLLRSFCLHICFSCYLSCTPTSVTCTWSLATRIPCITHFSEALHVLKTFLHRRRPHLIPPTWHSRRGALLTHKPSMSISPLSVLVGAKRVDGDGIPQAQDSDENHDSPISPASDRANAGGGGGPGEGNDRERARMKEIYRIMGFNYEGPEGPAHRFLHRMLKAA